MKLTALDWDYYCFIYFMAFCKVDLIKFKFLSTDGVWPFDSVELVVWLCIFNTIFAKRI